MLFYFYFFIYLFIKGLNTSKGQRSNYLEDYFYKFIITQKNKLTLNSYIDCVAKYWEMKLRLLHHW